MTYDPDKRKTNHSIFEHLSHDGAPEKGRNGHAYHGMHAPDEEKMFEDEEDFDTSSSLTDEIDHQILMHRDAHFGGDFGVMLAYYSQDEHIGINPDFDVERILYLAEIEKEMGQDLASIILSGAEAEAVGRARSAYARFKEIYELDEEGTTLPRLIADLILTEEEEPVDAIEAVVSRGTEAVPDLIALLQSDELYDPLYPGYGYAPYLAAACLGKIKDPHAIIPLFEMLSRELSFDEMVIVDALQEVGSEARDFLLKTIQSRPLTQDNLNAAFALIAFSQETAVAIACFEELQDEGVQEKPLLRTYLLCCCEALKESPYREAFAHMANDPKTFPELRTEMQRILKEWG